MRGLKKVIWRPFVLLVGLLILIIATGCGSGGNGQSVVNTDPEIFKVSYDMSFVITEGNRSYISINKSGNPGDDPSGILLILEAFEDAHPELEITGWKIEKQQTAHYRSPKIFGIWVDHRLSE